MEPARIRNFGIVAHIDAGKTTLSERLLYESGVEHRIGEVDSGTATMDWMPQERERGITITAAATTLPWREHQLNLIDTPGHVDFGVEVERSLRVLDGAVLVIDAVAGVQAQSEAVWRALERRRTPAIVFVNKCDRAGADFMAAVSSVQARLGAPVRPVHYPLNEGGHFIGHVDLLTLEAWDASARVHNADEPARRIELPASASDEARVLRAELLEALSEHDDEVLTALVVGNEPPRSALERAVRRATLARKLVPALCGAALRNVGASAVLDAVVDWLPSPLDAPRAVGFDPRTGERAEREPSASAPLSAFAFKLQVDAHGELCFLRVYSGRLSGGDVVWNSRTGKRERVGRLVRMHAEVRAPVESAGAGEIIAALGMHEASTGDTLSALDAPITFERLAFPDPVISMVVEPRSTADRDKLRVALARLEREDPTLRQREDEGTGQWVVSGMGELHLEVALQRLATEFGVEAAMGAPRVAYREALRPEGAPVTASARFERAIAGKEVFGAVELELRAGAGVEGDGAALEVQWDADCRVPAPYRSAVEAALRGAASVGPRFGFPLVGASVRVFGGESRPSADAEIGFVQAAVAALREASERAEVEILEPLMELEVQAPAEYSSGVIADLNARRAEVASVESAGAQRLVRGVAPLHRMFGYSTAVRSLSQGRASFTMRPRGLRPLPPGELVARGLSWS